MTPQAQPVLGQVASLAEGVVCVVFYTTVLRFYHCEETP